MADENVDTGQQTGTDAAAVAAAAAAAATAGNQSSGSDDPFSAFGFTDEDKDIQEWAKKTGFKDAKSIAKTAFEQQKLIGSSIRVPGKDATPEEITAFREKLGTPKEAKDYEFAPPKDLPEDLPYDGERADAFRAEAHKLGLTKEQAKGLHDWFANTTVKDFQSMGAQSAEKQVAVAKGETDKLTKLWGPLEGEQMRVNLSYADKVLREVGGDEALAEFQRVGLIGNEGKIIQSAPIAVLLAKVGAALYTEDSVLKGRADRLDNPFAEGKSYNVTNQMKMVKSDPEAARSFIAAAGKKPADFGLKD